MSVAFIKEITGRDGSKDVDTNKRYRRTWIVRTSNPVDGASIVLAAPGIPAFNSPYQYVDDLTTPNATITDANAVCIDIRATQDNANDPQDWRVVAEYAGIDDLLAMPAEVEYSPTRYQKSLVKDLDGKPVMNSAGDPFESGITVDRTRFTLTITKPVPTWDAATADQFQDSVNFEEFLPTTGVTAFPAGTCKLVWGAKRVRRAGTSSFYWLRTAVIDIDKEGWKVKVRDAGFKELVYSDAAPVFGASLPIAKRPIFDGPGSQAVTPRLLDRVGRSISGPGGRPLAPHEAVPDPLEFRGYNVKSWAGLNLQY